ncbi:MAG TPA: threonine synthase [Gemmatimonadales bacterium]|nr:threonine synthase [Gemmatimonadales bacterium]
MDWMLECSACGATESPRGIPSVCQCGQPWLVRYPARQWTLKLRDTIGADPSRGMWRFRAMMPITPGEDPVTLGEGDTPLLRLAHTEKRLGLDDLWMKDEAVNPTGSFKARGLSAAVTRARAAGVSRFVIPTAGNAGVAAAAYGASAGIPVRVYAPDTTPPAILAQIVSFGGELVRLKGHIGDCGKAARAFAAEAKAMDLSTLREPYRIEGKKTLGIEIALAMNWKLPAAIIYPTGGGTGLIGMWKAFQELRAAGWISGTLPRMFSVQSSGCAPVVRAFAAGRERAEPWAEPWTVASGLRVPGPLGDRLILQALAESGGGAVAVSDEELMEEAGMVAREEGIDMSPEGGAAVAAVKKLVASGGLDSGGRIVVFNTGAGWLYRIPSDLLPL